MAATQTSLRRVLTLKDLVFYGVVLITPIAPVGIFGVAGKMSRGHVATTVVIAMVAMLLTAWSYGRMAAMYPSAGSAYTYVGRGLHPHLGFLAGWAMFLDYLIIPIINVIYLALTLGRVFPSVPYPAWALLAAVGITALNLRGIRFTARANELLLAIMCLVIGGFILLAVRLLLAHSGWQGLFSIAPFYRRGEFDFGAVRTATSLAALTYIGFDGVTTLAEEVREPERTVPLATVLACLIVGLLSTLEVYLGQRVWPDYGSFSNPETAFLDVTGRVGGGTLFHAMAGVLVLASLGSGMTGQVGAARLLFGMGRDGVLPARFFARLSPRTGSPLLNIVLVGLIALAGALALSYELSAEILNFGAFLAFMGVNAALVGRCLFRRSPGERARPLSDLVVPLLGFLFCLGIWVSLPLPAKVAGGVWLACGIVYLVIRRRGFSVP